jgi:hypothetical protein
MPVTKPIPAAQVFRNDPTIDTASYYLRQAYFKATDSDYIIVLDPDVDEAMKKSLIDFIDNPVAEIRHWLTTGQLLIQPDPER